MVRRTNEGRSKSATKNKSNALHTSTHVWGDFDAVTIGGDTITLDAITMAGIKKQRTLLDLIIDGIDQGLLGYRDAKKEPVYVFDGNEDESVGHFSVYSKGSTITMMQPNAGLRAYLLNMLGRANTESEKLRMQAMEQMEEIERLKENMPEMPSYGEAEAENIEGPSQPKPQVGSITIQNSEEFFQALSLRNALLEAVAQHDKEAKRAAEEREDDSPVERDGTSEKKLRDEQSDIESISASGTRTATPAQPSASLSQVKPLEAILVTWQSRTKSPFRKVGFKGLDESIEATDMNISKSYFTSPSVSVEDMQGGNEAGTGDWEQIEEDTPEFINESFEE